MVRTQTLLYVYGVVPADAPPPPAEVRGLDGGSVRLLQLGDVAAVVSDVSATEYGEETLDSRLGDLGWVGERGIAHEAVLDWFLERGPVLPLSLFSIHHDEERIRARFAPEAERLAALLEELRGRREWGIKLWRRDEELTQHLERLSPTLRALASEVEQAAPGRRFLLAKKMETARVEELRAVSRRVAHQAYSMLREAAERATTLKLPPNAPDTGRVLLLHSAFLVPEDGFAQFQQRVTAVAHEFGGVGFEVEFTGPWPPYHFVEQDA